MVVLMENFEKWLIFYFEKRTRPASKLWCLVSAFGSNFQSQYVAAVVNATFLIKPYGIKSEKDVAAKPFLDYSHRGTYVARWGHFLDVITTNATTRG